MVLYYIVGILLAFAVWSAVSMGWYVCGIKDLCSVAEAQDTVAYEDGLVETQAPVAIGYEKSGAAGEIFVMLMIAFTLGALLGRTLATSASTEETQSETKTNETPVIHLPAAAKNVSPPLQAVCVTPSPVHTSMREIGPQPSTGGPVHISELTKRVPRPPVQVNLSAPQRYATPIRAQNIEKPTPVLETRAPIILPKYTPPHTPPQTKNPERHKIRFNTSWSNPVRNRTVNGDESRA